MNGLIHLLPLSLAALCWWLFYRFNRTRGWFRVGELIFWDAILLILIFLVWLIWF